MASVALLFHAMHHAGSLSLVASPTLRQSGELRRKVRELSLPVGFPSRGDGVKRHSLLLPNRAWVVAMPGNSPDGVRGFSGVTLMVVDEASMVREDLYVAARPMLTQKKGRFG